MLEERLAERARQGDGLDDVRRDALDRAGWLVRLLGRQRRAVRRSLFAPDPADHERAELDAEIAARLADCPADQRPSAAIVLLMAVEFDEVTFWLCHEELARVIPGTRAWTPGEVKVALVESFSDYSAGAVSLHLPYALTAAETLGADGRRSAVPWFHWSLRLLYDLDDLGASERRSLTRRLRRLLDGVDDDPLPPGTIPEHDPWAAPLRERGTPSPELAALVLHLVDLGGPPSVRWRRRCRELVDAARAAELAAACLHGLATAEEMCFREGELHWHAVADPRHGDLARALLWAAVLTGPSGAVGDLVAVAIRTGAPRPPLESDLALAGAAIAALGEIDDPAALDGLFRLRRTIRHRSLRKRLDQAFAAVAERAGCTPEQLLERGVPAHGLGADGAVTQALGDHEAVLRVEDAHTVRLSFVTPGGRTTRTVPAALREPHAAAIRELRRRAKEIRGALSGERARLDGLLSAEREWPYADWCRHYRDHPITGAVVRGLIWEFADAAGEWAAALPGEEPPAAERVRLWQPMRAGTGEILEWRAALTDRRLRQPVKQAFREIYLLTPAERETGTYSTRFAAHVVHYPRLYALFKERDWQANHLGAYDGGYEGTAVRTFAEGAWRAELDHVNADEDAGGTPEYATTGQVRFARRIGRAWAPARLADVPPVVFSEAMRDIDLFVGVASLAADPYWTDPGEDRYAAYRRSAAFGELTPGAEVRRDALARILPRTKIADRCALAGRYLTVRGDLRTYKIHLGSGNVLMEPDDAYLCVVPDRRAAAGGTVFLPFEEDRLALILSKAFLLAADAGITDAGILAQIKGGA